MNASAKVPTLVDVARSAGVSVSTAGRVLRDAEYRVDPALGERVRAAAARVGYVPNVAARSLRGGAPKLVGLIVGDMLDPYYAEVAEAVTQRAESSHGLLALVCNMQRDPLLEIKYCRQLWEHRVAGLVLAGGGFDQWTHLGQLTALVDQMRSAGVAIATLSPRNLSAPVFSVDNVAVGRVLAEAVVRRGHRAVGVLMGPPQSEVTQQRLRGIAGVLTQSGVRMSVHHGEYMATSGALAAEHMLGSDLGITCLIVGSDTMALGALEKLQAMGKRVPQDIALASIGHARIPNPRGQRLTTVDIGLLECGRAALDFISTAARARPPAAEGWAFQPRLIEGDTLPPL
jgi:LacI family transcriptional regulator